MQVTIGAEFWARIVLETRKDMDFCGGLKRHVILSSGAGPYVGGQRRRWREECPSCRQCNLDPARCIVGTNCRTVLHPASRRVQDDKLFRLLSEHYSFVAVDEDTILHVRSYRA